MSNIDNYYRSAVTYTQSPPTTDTFSSSFNYSTAENLYGSNVLLYTGLIPTSNPLTDGADGDKYAVDGIDIVEKVSVQALTAVDQSAFGFTDSRLTYLIPGSVYGITVWSKDQAGDYTVAVPPKYYDVFFYPQTGTYVIYFKDTSYEPMYRTADGLIGLQYAPAITCYRYCGPKGIENIPAGGGGATGPTGPQGETGPQGATGPTGSGSGGGLSGAQYVYVAAAGTDTQNATELQAAYNTAKTMSPSATNRITVVCGPGNYNFGSTTFTMDTQYIDLVSLDGNRSVVFNAPLNTGARSQGSISITANDIFVKGVDVQDKNFTIATNLNLLIIENCKGGDFSFGGDSTYVTTTIVNGTFIDCEGGIESFAGYGSTASGTFTNCKASNYSFAWFAPASGIFTNCTAGDDSYGFTTVSGTFINCIGGSRSFGGYNNSTSSGTFTNCIGLDNSFSGWFGGTASGIFNNCTGGDYSFGSQGTASGIFNNCFGASYSFGYNGTASGSFIRCSSFEYSFGYNGACSGVFENCTGKIGCFGLGGSGTLTGKLFYCRLTAGTFQTVSGSGRTYYCVDGNGNTNNQ